jgi:hypothetical protein
MLSHSTAVLTIEIASTARLGTTPSRAATRNEHRVPSSFD